MEILNSYVTQDVEWWGALIAFITIESLSVASAILTGEPWYIGLITGTLAFCIIIGVMFALGAFDQYTVYVARIDDSTSFKYIYDTYEVISQRGSIYTLKELMK